MIGAAMVGALAGLAIGGFWFATRAKEYARLFCDPSLIFRSCFT